MLQLSSPDVLAMFLCFGCDTALWGLFNFCNLFRVVLGSTFQECDTWRGRLRPGLTRLPQVHGEAAEGWLAEETAEVFSQELAATLLCVERKHSNLSQGWQGDHRSGKTVGLWLILTLIQIHIHIYHAYFVNINSFIGIKYLQIMYLKQLRH